MPYSIMLDAGHGGARDPGAVYNGRQEKEDNLNLVLAIGEILQNNGLDVEYTRTTDVYESPSQKAREANEAGVDFFVSIHRNSSPVPGQYMGVESLVYDLSGIKYEMAQNINAQLETVGFVNLGVKARPNLVVLRRTQMPAVLVEVGFINSETDNRIFDENFEAIAQAIARGILETLNLGGTETTGPGETEHPRVNYRVQVGAFRHQPYAQRLLRELTEQDFPADIYEGGPYYRVQVGNYETLDEAVGMERRLKRAGYPTVVVSS
ncbi:N-acetylmuramoyl-L-alanine amidase [Roseburia hominis]